MNDHRAHTPLLLILSMAVAACGGAASHVGTTEPTVVEPPPPPDAGAGPAMPEPVTMGTARCDSDADCVLATFACSPCGPCPDTLMYATHRLDLEAAQDECSPPPPPRPCSPCPQPDPEFRQWTRAACRDGRCVPTEPSPSLRELRRPVE